MNEQRKKSQAFTLIELLVVITVIALLVSILMPALSKAKASAQKTACMSNCKQVGLALQMYTAENNDWLPGPNTSGFKVGDSNLAGVNGSSRAPVQNTDWMSPLMGKMVGLPKDRFDRFLALANTDLSCPSNKVFYDGIYPDDDTTYDPAIIQGTKQVSYSAALAYLVYPDGSKPYPYVTDSPFSGTHSLPSGYAPRFNKVGRPSDKVFMMEGSRYVDSDFKVTFNPFDRQIQGGNYANYGPATPRTGDPYFINIDTVGLGQYSATLTKGTEKFAYRHESNGKPSMNFTYFDGHVSNLNLDDSLDVDLYWPKGSQISQGDTNDTSIWDNTGMYYRVR